jgi:hypothetical protein
MVSFIKAFVIFIFWLTLSFQSQTCNKLPTTFTSYAQAEKLISNSTFKLKESANTSESSWVRSAKFCSCDGVSGFFILGTDKKEYYHQNMPIEIWQGFKNATSFGSYYNQFIKNKYTLNVSGKPSDRQCTAIAKSSGNRCKNQSWEECGVLKCHTHCK